MSQSRADHLTTGAPSFIRPLRFFLMVGFACALALVPACGPKKEDISLDAARQAWERAEYPHSAELYAKVLARLPVNHPDHRTARFELARTYELNLRNMAAAAREYAKLLDELGEGDRSDLARDARRHLAETYGRLKQPREAINEYETLLLLFPELDDRRVIRAEIARLYREQGDFNQAVTEYRKVVENVPFDAAAEDAWQRIANISNFIQRKYDVAIDAYRILSEKSGNAAVRRTALLQIAECQVQLLRYEEAVETLRGITGLNETEQTEVRNRIRTIRKLRQTSAPPPEVDWSKKRPS